MAMIRCRECGNEISEYAEKCPNCGVKTRYGKSQEEKKANGKMLLVYLTVIVFGVYLLSQGTIPFGVGLLAGGITGIVLSLRNVNR